MIITSVVPACDGQAPTATKVSQANLFDQFDPDAVASFINIQVLQADRNSESFLEKRKKGSVDDADRAVTRLWVALQIPDLEDSRCDSCWAEVFRLDMDGNAYVDAVVRVQISEDGYRYLLYLAPTTGGGAVWRFSGYLDVHGQRYAAPLHRVVRIGESAWFALTTLGDRGTGIGLRLEDWYAVDSSGSSGRPALSYPLDGYENPWPMGLARDFNGGITEQHITDEGDEVTIKFKVDYRFETFEKSTTFALFSKTQTGVFRRQKGTKEFLLDPRRSTITADELDRVFRPDGLTREDFLRYNTAELVALASKGSAAQKAWLVEFLKTVDDVPEELNL